MQKKSNAAVNGVNINKSGVLTRQNYQCERQKNNSRTERFPEYIK